MYVPIRHARRHIHSFKDPLYNMKCRDPREQEANLDANGMCTIPEIL